MLKSNRLTTIRLLAWPLVLIAAAVGAQSAAPPAAESVAFEDFFRPATLRVDYFHGGDATEEFFVLDQVREEPGWAGPVRSLVTPFDRGRYQVRLHDKASGRLIFARGYATVFGEWQTVPEARTRRRIFRESVVMAFPRKPVEIVFLTRDSSNVFREKFRATIDPASSSIRRDPPSRSRAVAIAIESNGPPSEKVDLTLVAEGYTSSEADNFTHDAKRLTAALFSRRGLGKLREHFNVRAVFVPSPGSGIDEPARGEFRRTPLEASFDSFGLSRYVLVEDQVRLRDAVAGVPTDCIAVLVNSKRYGGGGIYNWFLTVTAGNPWAEYVIVHEFGHLFAGLADEYYSSAVTYDDFYPEGIEPVAPNITRLPGGDARERLKWGDLVAAGTPLPTPWPQAEYDRLVAAGKQRTSGSEERADAAARTLEREVETLRVDFLRKLPTWGRVGAYEGGGYVARGVYRPSLDCVMFSRSRTVPFCPVCRRAVARMVDYHTGRGTPVAGPDPVPKGP